MLQLLSSVLAAYRLAFFLVYEEGPLSIGDLLREKAGVEDLNPYNGQPKSWLGRLFGCPYCMGVYASAFFILVGRTTKGKLLVDLFAVAGGQHLIQTMVSNQRN